MREIKFRAWDKRLKQWIAKDFHVLGEFSLFGSLGQYLAETKHLDMNDFERLNDIEIGQYTGLKDKNGVEIYEGDIVICSDRPYPIEVVYKEACFYTPEDGGNYRLGGWEQKAIEVIGNIHENPELLEEL